MDIAPLNLLCPACHTPLPADADAVVTCGTCSAEVDVTRAGTISGRPRFVPEIDRTGTNVGGYRIEARLGGGGMGTVYRATAIDGCAAVALKFLAPALADNADVVARFAREIATLTRLEHPAIVRVLGHGTEDGTPWFAMALVEGSDLRTRIAIGALPPAETGSVFGRLFAALAHAHERGVVHRDLKPANVLLGGDGAQLADFGIAHLEAELLTGPNVTRLTQTAAVLGTLPYMSPEQRRGAAVDRRSDLFSAGVMLYEAATGVLPQGAFAPPSRLNAAYGRAFDRIVMQLLQADPARRPSSAADGGRALSAALSRRTRGPIALLGAGAALALILAGGRVGVRALFRHDGKTGKEALAKIETTEPRKATAAADAQTPPSTDGLTKLLGPEDGEKQRPRGKIRSKVVLKAVADVKKLRAVTSKATAPATLPLSKSGSNGGGKKKSKAALADDAFAPELDEGLPARAGVQPRRSDAGAPPPPRK
jgi:hypothetical protein